MSQSIVQEALFALKCVGMGVVITLAYDLLRIGRNCVKHSHFMISLEDFIFWVICAIFIFSVLYLENNGILRWYCVGGALFGMLVYGKTISPYFVRFMSAIGKKTLYLVSKGMHILFWPFRRFFGVMSKGGKKLCKFFTKKKKQKNK